MTLFTPLFLNVRNNQYTNLNDYYTQSLTDLASVGQGNDDSNSINNVISELAQYTNKTTLWVPDGLYKIASPIILNSRVAMNLSSNARFQATASMDAMFKSTDSDEQSFGWFIGGFLDANNLAEAAIWPKWFSGYNIQNIQILDHIGVNGAIRLGSVSAPVSSYEAFISYVRINRTGAAPANVKGIYFNNCGDSHISNTVIIGQKYGVYGTYNDSKLDRVHCWNYGPTHGSLSIGFSNLGVDTIFTQCQVDGPCDSNCFYINGARNIILGCGTNNPTLANGGTDQTAGCVFVDSGASAYIGFCTFKGAADARWAIDIAGSGTIHTFNNFAVNTTSVYGGTADTPHTIASGNFPVANEVTITGIPDIYSMLHLKIDGASCDTAARHLNIQVSTNNGSTWDTAAGNYIGYTVAAGVVAAIADASLIQTADVAAANAHTVGITIQGYNSASGHAIALGRLSNGTTNYNNNCAWAGSAAINAIKILWSGAGNFDAGSYTLRGIP